MMRLFKLFFLSTVLLIPAVNVQGKKPTPEIPEINAQNDVFDLNNMTPKNGWYALPVLANDTGEKLKIKSINPRPQKGSVKNSSSSISYKPNINVTGTDSFSYTIEDKYKQTASASVTITLPIIEANNDSASTPKNTQISIDVLNNDNGVPPLKISSYDRTSSKGGKIKKSGTILTYNPPMDFTGTDTFSYTMEDKIGNKKNATVTITVGETGGSVLRTIIYNTSATSSEQITNSLTATNHNNPHASPTLIFLMYNKVFETLTDPNTDTLDELSAEERTHLQNNVRDKFLELHDLRKDIENDENPNPTKINDFNTQKNALQETLNTWVTEHPGDSSEN